MPRKYIRFESSSERLIPEDIVLKMEGLREVASRTTRRLNPVRRPPKFEFLMLSKGEGEPIKYYFGTRSGDHLNIVQSAMNAAYPDSYDIYIEEVDIAEHTDPFRQDDVPSAFVEQLSDAEALLSDGGSGSFDLEEAVEEDSEGENEDEELPLGEVFADNSGDREGETVADSANGSSKATRQTQGEIEAQSEPPLPESLSDELSANAGGELSADMFDHIDPVGVHWFGKGERRADWQTLIKPFSQIMKRHRRRREEDVKQRRAPLATIIDEISKAKVPVAYQVMFCRRRVWSLKARRRKARVEGEVDGLAQTAFTLPRMAMGGLLGEEDTTAQRQQGGVEAGEQANEQVSDTGKTIGARTEHIDRKDPEGTFRANIRAVAFVPECAADRVKETALQRVEGMANGFNSVKGPYYKIRGRVVDDDGSLISQVPSQEELLDSFINRNIALTRVKRTRKQLTLNADELANFITIPNAEALTEMGARGTRSQTRDRSPLKLPTPDKLESYSGSGLAIGYPLNEHGDTLDTPVRIPQEVLLDQPHYIRSAVSGHGKSVAGQWDLLSFHEHTDGLNILIEPKGGAMATNYLREHYKRYGDLDDVIYFNFPEYLPGIPFFDIRPKLAAGYDRDDAVQDRIEQFDDIMRILMGADNYEDATAALGMVKSFIRAGFDRKYGFNDEYGGDAFTVNDLREAVIKFQNTKEVPNVCEDNRHVEQSLSSDLNSSEQYFNLVIKGVINRFDPVSSDNKLRKIFNNIPEWDDEEGEYKDNGFNFQNLINEDKTIIFDMGALSDRSTTIMSLLLLSRLWDVTKLESRQSNSLEQPFDPDAENDDDRLVACVIEEAKDIAHSKLVEDLLAQGREFGLCLGLVMQFPSQVDGNQSSTSNEEVNSYEEIIKNVRTKILGEIQLAGDFAELLETDQVDKDEFRRRLSTLPDGEWMVKLPEAGWLQNKPKPFNIQSLERPPGHPEGDAPLTNAAEKQLREDIYPEMLARTARNYCVGSPADTTNDDGESKSSNNQQESGDSTEDDTNASTSYQDTPTHDEPTSPGSQQPGTDASHSSPGQPSDGPGTASNGTQADTAHSQASSDEGQSPASKVNINDAIDAEGIGRGTDSVDILEQGTENVDTDGAETPEQIESGGGAPFPSSSDKLGSSNLTTDSEASGGKHSESEKQTTPSSPSNSAGDSEESAGTPVTGSDHPFEDGHFPHVEQERVPRAEDVRFSDVQFLQLVLDAMNGELDGYELTQSMVELPVDRQEINIEALTEQGYLDEHVVCRQRYYTVTEDGRKVLGDTLNAGHNVGDLGEKTPHRVGVHLLKKAFEQESTVQKVSPYHEPSDGGRFDIAGFAFGSELIKVGEVETVSNNVDSVLADYDDLRDADAAGVWAFPNVDAAVKILSVIEENRDVDFTLPSYSSDSLRPASLRESIKEASDPGVSEIYTFRPLSNMVAKEQ